VRVLQISKFFPPVMGGIEAVAWELAEGLQRAGIANSVLCANQQPRTVHDRGEGGYEVVRSASLGMLLSTSMAPAMLQDLRKLAAQADVVHVHMPDPMAAAALASSRCRAKVVVHWHSDVIRQRWAMRLYQPLQDWLLRRADAIVATSEPYAHSSPALKHYTAKVRVIPIGISDNANQARPERVAMIRQQVRGKRIVFALGRMTYYKGFEVLIDSAQGLPDDVAVLIGGDGELLQNYKTRAAQLGLAGKVRFLGHIAENELPNYFAACDVYCMPSTARAEAYGVAMLEAMVMGKPIVASDIAGSGVPWVNVDGETGFNVPVRQPQALASAICRLLEDAALRERMGAAGRRRYLNFFNAALMSERTATLYDRVLSDALARQ
jgi:glycosyltransferase involved in cell wall biosynthesis